MKYNIVETVRVVVEVEAEDAQEAYRRWVVSGEGNKTESVENREIWDENGNDCEFEEH